MQKHEDKQQSRRFQDVAGHLLRPAGRVQHMSEEEAEVELRRILDELQVVLDAEEDKHQANRRQQQPCRSDR
jgi:hypothetical protein